MAKKAAARKPAAGARKRVGASRTPARSKQRAAAAGARKKPQPARSAKPAARKAAAASKPGRGATARKAGRKAAPAAARKTGRKAAAPKAAAPRRSAKSAAPASSKRAAPPRASAKRPVAKPPVAKRPVAQRGPAKVKAPARSPRRGGTGDERTLAQTPETGRSVGGPTNPMPTKRSTGTAAGAGSTKHAPGLERSRRQLREVEEHLQGPPSSLDLDRSASAARSGRAELQQARREHNETSPEMTAGDVDADWQDAYASGDEAPGGDNPTPDQDRVDDIGKALGVVYEDNEELKAADKITERDKHRWELDPASAEDYPERD